MLSCSDETRVTPENFDAKFAEWMERVNLDSIPFAPIVLKEPLRASLDYKWTAKDPMKEVQRLVKDSLAFGSQTDRCRTAATWIDLKKKDNELLHFGSMNEAYERIRRNADMLLENLLVSLGEHVVKAIYQSSTSTFPSETSNPEFWARVRYTFVYARLSELHTAKRDGVSLPCGQMMLKALKLRYFQHKTITETPIAMPEHCKKMFDGLIPMDGSDIATMHETTCYHLLSKLFESDAVSMSTIVDAGFLHPDEEGMDATDGGEAQPITIADMLDGVQVPFSGTDGSSTRVTDLLVWAEKRRYSVHEVDAQGQSRPVQSSASLADLMRAAAARKGTIVLVDSKENKTSMQSLLEGKGLHWLQVRIN